MDQNTNNSFTSAPQGGDFSDIIIPNAYVAKPKGKNLKKYIVFGVIGLVVLFLIGLIAKAIFVDSRTMSKEEVTKLANSDDMKTIDRFESLLFQIYNNQVSFDFIMEDSVQKIIDKADTALSSTKKILDKKKKARGNNLLERDYSLFLDSFEKRYTSFMVGISRYKNFQQAYNTLNTEYIKDYVNDDGDLALSLFAKNVANIIEENKLLTTQEKNGNCNYIDGVVTGSHECKKAYSTYMSIKAEIDSNGRFSSIFAEVFNDNNYMDRKNLKIYLGDYVK